jgi:5-methylcytosine-specific restriction endonuclease McrBC regulatory subunit McrC
VTLAKIVLSGAGIDLRSTGGRVSLPPMMISMEQAFEAYLRNVLSDGATELFVQDGNLAPPLGARANLFHDAPACSRMRHTKSTPDIVVSPLKDPSKRLVIDVKYKPDVSRDDLNQVLGYALTYRSSDVLLACPRKHSSAPVGLQLLGCVDAVRVFQYWVDLGVADIEREEQEFVEAIAHLLERPAS